MRTRDENSNDLITSLNSISSYLVSLGKVFINLSGVKTNIEISFESYKISIHYSTLKYVPNKQKSQSQSSVAELPEPKSLQWSQILERKLNVLSTIFAEIKKRTSLNQNEQKALEFLKDFIIYYIVFMHHKEKESTILNPYAEL